MGYLGAFNYPLLSRCSLSLLGPSQNRRSQNSSVMGTCSNLHLFKTSIKSLIASTAHFNGGRAKEITSRKSDNVVTYYAFFLFSPLQSQSANGQLSYRRRRDDWLWLCGRKWDNQLLLVAANADMETWRHKYIIQWYKSEDKCYYMASVTGHHWKSFNCFRKFHVLRIFKQHNLYCWWFSPLLNGSSSPNLKKKHFFVKFPLIY